MKKSLSLLFVIGLVLATSGCNRLAYQPDIQQGNPISAKQVAALHIGMSRQQVRNLFGTPQLVNTFSDRQWFYVYTFKHGHHPTVMRKLTITFRGNRVAHFTSDLSGQTTK